MRQKVARAPTKVRLRRPPSIKRIYSYWFYLPAALVFGIFFSAPDGAGVLLQPDALDDLRLDLYRTSRITATFFRDPQLTLALKNTLIFAFLTSGLKIVLGLPLALTAHLGAKSSDVLTQRRFLSGSWSAPSRWASPSRV